MVVTIPSFKQAQECLSLQRIWETIDANSCPYNYNFHMHTNCSDGRLKPSELIDRAIEIGLKGIAITDHHSIKGYLQAKDYIQKLQKQNRDRNIPTLWTGMEITSNLQGVEVHILAYAFDPEHPALKSYINGTKPQGNEAYAKNVIDRIHQGGGVAVLAHPGRYRRPMEELIPLAVHLGIDGVEAYYAYRKTSPWKPTPKQTKQALELAHRYELYTTCGTDSHGLNLLERT